MNDVEKAREEAKRYAEQSRQLIPGSAAVRRDRLDVAHDRMRGEYDPFATKVDPSMYRGGDGPLPAGGAISGETASSGCSRMAAREALRQRAYELRRKAQQLDALAGAIPDNFPADAESALWDLAMSVHTF